MNKDMLKRLLLWPLSDNSINKVLKTVNAQPLNVPIAQENRTVPVNTNMVYKAIPKNIDNEVPGKYPEFMQKMEGNYLYPSAERESEVAKFMTNANQTKPGVLSRLQ